MNKGKRNFIALGIIAVFMIPFVVYGKGTQEYYDSFFKNNEFVINTDVSINDGADLNDVVYNATGKLEVVEEKTSEKEVYTIFSNISCDFDTQKCDFFVKRVTCDIKNGGYYFCNEGEYILEYKGIQLKINNNIADKFPMINENKLQVNYDERFIKYENEEFSRISEYLSEYSQLGRSYNYDSYYKTLTLTITNDNLVTEIYNKAIDEVVFKDTDRPYSDGYKKLTSDGKVIIKAPELNDKFIERFFKSIQGGNEWFSIESDIIDNQAYVLYYGNESSERHLVTFELGETDDKMFNKYYKNGKLTVNLPEGSQSSSLDSIMYLYGFKVDGWNERFEVELYTDLNDEDKVLVSYINKKGQYDCQFKILPIEYAGYSKEYSEEFSKIKDGLTVYSDVKDYISVSSALLNDMNLLSCDDDYKTCEISYYDRENNTVEVHNVEIHQLNIIWDDKISEEFKKIFNLDDNNILTIVTDVTDFDIINYSRYDEARNFYYNYYCNKDTCTLTFEGYEEGQINEKRVVKYRIVNSKTDYYKENIYDKLTIYPGENINYWYTLCSDYYNYFSKDKSVESRSYECDKYNNVCKVSIINSDGNLEMHAINVEVKDEVSPEFALLFLNNKLKLDAVYLDDYNYLNAIVVKRLSEISKETKKRIYLYNLYNGRVLVTYDNLERQYLDLEFVDKNDEIKKALDEVANNIEKAEINISFTDLENMDLIFDNIQGSYGYVFKNKIIDAALNKYVTDSHITYETISRDINYDTITTNHKISVILYYDGVAYGYYKDLVVVNRYSVIYIPEDTKDTEEDYIAAIKKKLEDNYGKGYTFEVYYEDKIEKEDYDNVGLDISKSDGKLYYIYASKDDECFGEYVVAYKLGEKTPEKVPVVAPELNVTDEVKEVQVGVTNKEETQIVINDSLKNNEEYKNMDNVSVVVEVETNEKLVDTKDMEAIKKEIGNKSKNIVIGSFFDITLNVVNTTTDKVVGTLSELTKGIKLTVVIPNELKNVQSGYTRKYYIVRYHNGEAEMLTTSLSSDGKTLSFESDKFSTYAIAYEDVKNTQIKNPNTIDAVTYFEGAALIAILGLLFSIKYIIRES